MNTTVTLTEEEITSLRTLGKTISKILKVVDSGSEVKPNNKSKLPDFKSLTTKQMKDYFNQRIDEKQAKKFANKSK